MLKKIIVIMAILSIVIVVGGCTKDEKVDYNLDFEATFKVMNGTDETVFDLAEIRELGEVEFTATLDTSDSDPIEYNYVGVLLKDIYKEANVTITETSMVVIEAEDGYKVVLEGSKVLEDDNVYLAYVMNGEALDSNSGPLQTIVSKDQFSKFWCKFASSTYLE